MISSDLQLDEIGRALSERAVDVYQIDGVELISRWFHSGNDCDLMVWLDGENELVRFQFNISGQIVDWNRLAGFKTGLIVETEYVRDNKSGVKDVMMTETINYDKSASQVAINTAKKVLLAAREIRAPWREKMVRLLASDRTRPMATVSREARPRFWSRFKHWVAG